MKPRLPSPLCAVGALASLPIAWSLRPGGLQPDGELALLVLAPVLLVLLGSPWSPRPAQPSATLVGAAVILVLALGGACGSVLLVALGGTLAVLAWGRACLEPAQLGRLHRLLPLALCAFPWFSTDLVAGGWWLRLVGANGAALILHLGGVPAVVEGTQLILHGTDVDVAPACAGLGTLQAILLATCAWRWSSWAGPGQAIRDVLLAVLVTMLANMVRIAALGWCAEIAGAAVATQLLHALGGAAPLAALLGLGWLIWSIARDAVWSALRLPLLLIGLCAVPALFDLATRMVASGQGGPTDWLSPSGCCLAWSPCCVGAAACCQAWPGQGPASLPSACCSMSTSWPRPAAPAAWRR